MAEETAAETRLLRSQKTKLIEILGADPDFVLQHADSRALLSPRGYQQVKSCRIPSEKVTELLDQIIQRGAEAVQGFLDLLKEPSLQETFPMLRFIKDLQVNNTPSPGRKETKRKPSPEPQEIIPVKKICNNGGVLVNEKQLMSVARLIGKSWREIGRLALDIQTVKLEQIEEDHSTHVERVFAMLRYWRTRQREKATAVQLHFLLSQDDWALPPENVQFLLKPD